MKIAYSNIKTSSALGLGALMLCAAATAALADYIPGFGSSSIQKIYRSEEPITIRFEHPKLQPNQYPTAVVPKSYIFFSTGSKLAARDGINSNSITASEIAISFMASSGISYVNALHEISIKDSNLRTDDAARILRHDYIEASIHPNTNDEFGKGIQQLIIRTRTQYEDFDGVAQYRLGDKSTSYFVGSDADEFITIRCPNPVSPIILCTYQMKVSRTITAGVTMADFRQRGGRTWANSRLKFAREKILSFF